MGCSSSMSSVFSAFAVLFRSVPCVCAICQPVWNPGDGLHYEWVLQDFGSEWDPWLCNLGVSLKVHTSSLSCFSKVSPLCMCPAAPTFPAPLAERFFSQVCTWLLPITQISTQIITSLERSSPIDLPKAACLPLSTLYSIYHCPVCFLHSILYKLQPFCIFVYLCFISPFGMVGLVSVLSTTLLCPLVSLSAKHMASA